MTHCFENLSALFQFSHSPFPTPCSCQQQFCLVLALLWVWFLTSQCHSLTFLRKTQTTNLLPHRNRAQRMLLLLVCSDPQSDPFQLSMSHQQLVDCCSNY